MKTLLKNGTVIDYASKTNEKLDVLMNLVSELIIMILIGMTGERLALGN